MATRHRMNLSEVASAKQQTATLLRNGFYIQEICRQLQLPETSVRRWAVEMGIPIATCRSGPQAGPAHPNWLGGRRFDKHGYVQIWMPLHPGVNHIGVVWEHRLVSEVVLGRYLARKEVVDHVDGHPRHNWPTNLNLYATNAEHLRATLTGRAKASPRASIPGAYGSLQKLLRCPDEHETLTQCTSEIRQRISWYIESHRPTTEHRTLPRRSLRSLGAHRDPWTLPSTA